MSGECSPSLPRCQVVMVSDAVLLRVPSLSSIVLHKEAFRLLRLIDHLERCLDCSCRIEDEVHSDALLGVLILLASLTPSAPLCRACTLASDCTRALTHPH